MLQKVIQQFTPLMVQLVNERFEKQDTTGVTVIECPDLTDKNSIELFTKTRLPEEIFSDQEQLSANIAQWLVIASEDVVNLIQNGDREIDAKSEKAGLLSVSDGVEKLGCDKCLVELFIPERFTATRSPEEDDESLVVGFFIRLRMTPEK